MTKNHIFIMLTCCLIPIAIFGVILIFKIPISTVLLFSLVLICPLSHLLMMKYMGHGHATKQKKGLK